MSYPTQIRRELAPIIASLVEILAPEPPPPDAEYYPIDAIYLFPSKQGTVDVPEMPYRKEWEDPNAVATDAFTDSITYPRVFMGLDENDEPMFDSLTIPVPWAKTTSTPQPESGNVEDKEYLPFPCRRVYSYEQVIRSQTGTTPGHEGYKIKNLAYQRPPSTPTEFTEGDHRMIEALYEALL